MSGSQYPGSAARRDAIVVGVLVLAAFLLAAELDVYERWHAFAAAHEAWEIDEVPLAFALTTFAFAAFAWRRWREARQQAAHGRALNDRLRVEIAAREANEETVRRGEERFRQFAESASDWLWEMDADLRFSYQSDRVEQVSGLKADSVVGTSFYDRDNLEVDPDAWRRHLDDVAMRRPFRGFECGIPTPGRGTVWISITGLPMFDEAGGFTGYRGTGTDITVRKQAEIAREESERRFQDFAEAGSDWFWEMNADLRFTWLSSNIEQAMGTEAARLVGRSRHDLREESNSPEEWWAHLDQLAKRQPFRDFTYSVNSAKFGRIWVQISGVPVFDGEGAFAGYRGVGRMVTDLKEAEAALRQREAEATTARRRLLDAIEAMTEGFAMYDADDRLVLCNRKYKQMYAECAPAIVQGARFEDILRYGLARGQYVRAVGREEAWLAERMAAHRHAKAPIEQQLSNGRWLLINERRTEDGGYVGVRTDLTELKKRDEQLNRVQRLDAIGKMTGGVAHDFNNLLTIVIGNLQLLQREPDLHDAAKGFLQDGLDAAVRGAELTQRMLAFGRRQLLQPKVVDINELVSGMDALMRRTIGPTVAVETRLAPDLPRMLIDPGQFENALLNLAINARDAMPQGGRLTIETAAVELTDEDLVGADDVEPGTFVMLAVTDTGTGMPAVVIEHVFEPFFTTKEPGKGTGLGLSMVYGFVKQSLGHLCIDSEVGGGTTVRLYCPHNPTADAAGPDRLNVASDAEVEGGCETILVVDDEPAVRRATVNMLKQLGYATAEAGDGDEALSLLQARSDIDLLLTDVIMPSGLSGTDLVRAAKQRRNDLAVVLTSGYSDEGLPGGEAAMSNMTWLPKPFLTPQLAEKVRAALGSRSGEGLPNNDGVGDAY